jgi:bacterioferritin
LNPIHIGSAVDAMHHNDVQAEYDAIQAYNQGIARASEIGDNGTRDLLESILTEEEGHADWLEAQLDQIDQIGLQNYLVEQID